MEQVLKSADSFLHVLETANSSRVSTWGADDLAKALSWAEHHQQVYKSFKDREKVRNMLDIELKKLAYRNCILINIFGFQFLRDCKVFLVSILQSNSALARELAGSLPEISTPTENTLIFNCLLHINKTLSRDDQYVSHITSVVCRAISAACEFQRTCPVVTTAPQRAITTMLSRVYQVQKSHDLFLKCFVAGDEEESDTMVKWVARHGTALFAEGEVPGLCACSEKSAEFCRLHVGYIVELFGKACGYRNQHIGVLHSTSQEAQSKTEVRPSSTDTEKNLIFGPLKTNSQDGNCQNLVELSKHLVLLHTTSCYRVVEELLKTLSRHARFGKMAKTFSEFLSPNS